MARRFMEYRVYFWSGVGDKAMTLGAKENIFLRWLFAGSLLHKNLKLIKTVGRGEDALYSQIVVLDISYLVMMDWSHLSKL